MSLKDTIDGARQEALDAQDARSKSADNKKNEEASEADQSREGFVKRSAARGKPAREAAQGVRVVSASEVRSGKQTPTGKRESEMSKEERKEARKARRSAEDKRTMAANALLRKKEGYRRNYRMFMILLGIGMAAAVVSWIVTTLSPDAAKNPVSPVGLLATTMLALAYAAIIYAFIYDWRHVRPLRKAIDAEVAAMNDRKVDQVLKDDAKESAREQMEKAQAKAAKKSQGKDEA